LKDYFVEIDENLKTKYEDELPGNTFARYFVTYPQARP
jgi:hypothetical protein